MLRFESQRDEEVVRFEDVKKGEVFRQVMAEGLGRNTGTVYIKADDGNEVYAIERFTGPYTINGKQPVKILVTEKIKIVKEITNRTELEQYRRGGFR